MRERSYGWAPAVRRTGGRLGGGKTRERLAKGQRALRDGLAGQARRAKRGQKVRGQRQLVVFFGTTSEGT